jgi:hypothetical protein
VRFSMHVQYQQRYVISVLYDAVTVAVFLALLPVLRVTVWDITKGDAAH